ncbi:carboxylesterase [Bacillus lacus]|uniref:Carboxylesterase n=1 Tax=Metabacillus lacus TaxID=1983721 RepID=A0A7X2LYZ9_9BACI|nr:alpha/beta hydrolase [Metabacillus lacus]MRX72906.1 carboxylesterase [Metabacillus lacus]
MKHIFKQGAEDGHTLLLLHGTGGNEHDLLSLASIIDPSANILSIRGNVLENGMPRFFRRLAEGVFDEEDLKFRTKELYDFIGEASKTYSFNNEKVIAAGYSNGANIAASILFHYSNPFAGAILHHPMVPLRGMKLPNLTGVPVFIGAGSNDPICTPQETNELEQHLTEAGADVHVHWEQQGHQLTGTEAEAAAEWYKKIF